MKTKINGNEVEIISENEKERKVIEQLLECLTESFDLKSSNMGTLSVSSSKNGKIKSISYTLLNES